jgi:DNA-directed RNA polymerase subunit beta'
MPTKVTTPGRVLLEETLPKDIDFGTLDKKGIQSLFSALAEKYPDKYVDILHDLNREAVEVATSYGNDTSFTLDDFELPPRLKEYRKRLQERVDNIAQSPVLTPQQKNEKIINLMKSVSAEVRDRVIAEGRAHGNRLVKTFDMGSRGNPTQITQILFGDLLMADHKGRPVPLPGLHGYGEGVTPSEYWAGAYGSRAGFASVQLNTQKSGFLTKKMAALPHRVRVTGEDCGAKHVGIPLSGDDPDLVGHVLAVDTSGLKAGTVLSKKDLSRLRQNDEVLVRSMLTCQQPEGVCQKCSGLRESGRFPAIGDRIGVEYTRLVGEPITQKQLSSKHTGGLVGETDVATEDLSILDKLFSVPKHFPKAAILSPAHGKVSQVMKAPQGGHYVMVGTNQLYIPEDREVTVSKGDILDEGDSVSTGIVNPAEIIKYKGIGAGRVYFLKQLQDLLKKNGVNTHLKNLEPMAREFFNRVEITSPDAFEDFDMGDLVSYSDIQRQYKPRPSSRIKNVKYTSGMYLERPVLEYSIGTKITPSVAKRLSSRGVGDVMVNDQPPPFEPRVVRLDDILSTDKDFRVSLGGWGKKKSFLEAARRGAVSEHGGTSDITYLMNPSEGD